MDNYTFLEKLKPNCRASHIFKLPNEENVLPIKIKFETPSKSWNIENNEYNGLYLFFLSSESKILIIHINELNTKRTRTMTILNQYEKLLININENEIFNKLKSYFNIYSVTLNDVLSNTKYNVIPREEILLNRKNTNELESNGHDEIISLLGNNFLETPEKCKSDAGYFLNDKTKCIGIQTKTATIQTNKNVMNLFHNTNNYDGLLLFCRPMIRLYIGTIIIPGSLIKVSSFSFSLKNENTMYTSYLVPDAQLHSFMKKLYNAVINNEKELMWPLGKIVDISSIQLTDFNQLCIPNYKSDLLEYEFNKWRKEKFTNFIYEMPKIQGQTVDTIINGIGVQDKIAGHNYGKTDIYVANLKKNNGRNMKKKNFDTSPYEEGDFECLFVFLNNTKKYVFVIPSHVLIDKGILK